MQFGGIKKKKWSHNHIKLSLLAKYAEKNRGVTEVSLKDTKI